VAWVFVRHQAGYVGAGAWFILLFLPAMGLKRVAELANHHQFAAARRLGTVLQVIHPSTDLRSQLEVFRSLEQRQTQGSIPISPHSYSDNAPREWQRLRGTWAVPIIMLVNVAVFAVEGRSSTDPMRLLQLGALEADLVLIGHQYWRLGTALFLHYGILHLLFNMFALYLLGPTLERVVGGTRFLFFYLVAGLGSSAGVVLLTRLHLVQPGQLVGASGCVMGVVGAWAGFLLRHQHIPDARARLKNILTIIGVQVLFDISTPQVSMSAHLCGLVTGFALGLVLTRRIPDPIHRS
jgi:membrane associated rhomboid family serine protease